MKLTINGKAKDYPEPLTLALLLQHLQLAPALLVVELNSEIIRSEEHPHIDLKTGDKLEIVQFVGGG